MRIESSIAVDAFTIFDGEMPRGKGVLDPITVFLRDFGGSGQIVVTCYGSSWAHWFGAIGQTTLRKFVAGCDYEYLSGKLTSVTHRCPTRREQFYVENICRAVIAALKDGAA